MTTVVCFRAAEDEYAVAVEHVREICSHETLRPLAGARPGVAGLLLDQGGLLTVFATLATDGDHVLILERGDRAFGLLVGEVTRVVTVDGQLGEPPRGREHDYIAGVFSTGGGPLLLIDVDALDERLGS